MAKKTIKTPVEGFDGIVVGVAFSNGVGHTDDESAISYFERHGYEVAGHVDEDADREYPLGDPSDKWTVKQLLAYAKDRGITIESDVKTKDQIWAAIQPGGTPYKGVTTPEGEALVNDSTDPKDKTVKDQADLPVK
ncbi:MULTISPECIES: hypothetical protein [unclassified Microbacterium]|uniref:hypothetical protein n=1 Tax=unclassified Microbacterium TaxID=2609290 RepID=UPI00160525E4|nr:MULTISPECIES: hypothetical protein [unclassified Microbacterium]QNA93257.1 hypothetical protein G4G29_14725 [Microbacterium sp. Se63.02b]QYM63466.1 hypothetical protein K1X59_14775 [Microbacterium sp. Se5.02b]